MLVVLCLLAPVSAPAQAQGDEQLWVWGLYPYTGFATTSQRVEGAWSSASAGLQFACGIRDDDSLWCWGRNDGRLGVEGPTTVDHVEPVRVGTDGWRSVDTGSNHTCAIRLDDTLWCWGSDSHGQLGNGQGASSSLTPVQVGSNAWQQVAAGNVHTCAIRTDGSLWCWGQSISGQLGVPDIAGSVLEPTRVGTASWADIATGGGHTCGIQSDASLWCWGGDSLGQLGNGSRAGSSDVPVRVGSQHWIDVSLDQGASTTCAIDVDGGLWCWGNNGSGQVGIGTRTPGGGGGVGEPTRVGSTAWSDVDVGAAHVCGIRSDSTLWCWGNNEGRQVGVDAGSDRWVLAPARVGTATGWTAVDAGTRVTFGFLAGSSGSGAFVDDDGNVHEPMIERIAAAGITGGCDASGRRYCPGDPVRRDQMATFLARAFDLPPASEDHFDDDDGSGHEDNVNRVAAAGIAGGTATGMYDPSGTVTRAQMATFLARAAELAPTTTGPFTDLGSNGHGQNINAIAAAGITGGCDPSGHRYCPNDPVGRDQMATFLARAARLDGNAQLGLGGRDGHEALAGRAVGRGDSKRSSLAPCESGSRCLR